MKEKKHNLIYQITNLVNGKIYIGRHITNNINDGYMGSGNEIKKAIKEFGKVNFKKEILFDFKTIQEMIDKELELLTEEFVQSDSTYNIFDNTGGRGMMGKTHTSEVREVIRQTNIGFVTAKDKDGNTLRISKNDPRYVSGELKHNTHGTAVVKDKDGNKFRVPIDDPRRLTGELVGSNSGVKQTQDRIQNRVKKTLEFWMKNTHTDEAIEKMRTANLEKVNVRDKDGNEFRVSINDERYLCGELTVACKGSVWIHNDELKKSRFVRPEKVQKWLDEGWEYGLVYYNKKLLITIKNETLQQTKRVPEDELENYLSNGWIKGKIAPTNVGELISKSRKKYNWMFNLETFEERLILRDEIDKYLQENWLIGRNSTKNKNK